jgi:hypothetical protein
MANTSRIFVMRRAFVVTLANQAPPADGRLEGWVEEVDTSIQIRFRSAEQLVDFLVSRSVAASGRSGRTAAKSTEVQE